MATDQSMALLKRAFEHPLNLYLSSPPSMPKSINHSDVLQQRLEGVNRLRTFALALGFERTRAELLEFLTSKIKASLTDPPVSHINHPAATAPKSGCAEAVSARSALPCAPALL